jgi:hypothetical protein
MEFLRNLYTEIVLVALSTGLELPVMCSYNTEGFQSTTAFIGHKNTLEDMSRPKLGPTQPLIQWLLGTLPMGIKWERPFTSI